MKLRIHEKDFDSWDEINKLLKETLSEREIKKLPSLPSNINTKDHPFWAKFAETFGDESYKKEEDFFEEPWETLGDINNHVVCRLF
jgi:hypothetical protein